MGDYIIQELPENFLEDQFSDYGIQGLNSLSYNVIGCAMEVYNALGKGFSEVVYKDCLVLEFENKKIIHQREKKYEIVYKGTRIPHFYVADFIVEEKIILEIKAQSNLVEQNIRQVLNYLAASKCKVGLLINFGEDSLKFRRVILTK